jgi:hypothetical protein
MAPTGDASGLPRPRPVENPLVRRLVCGRVTSTRPFKVVGGLVALPCLALPALLVALAATQPSSGPDPDTARTAQLVWAVCLVVVGLLVVLFVARAGARIRSGCIVRRFGGRTVTVPWEQVTGFAAAAGGRPGVYVLRAGEAPLQVPTPWHTMSFATAREAADELNDAFGFAPPRSVGAPTRYANVPQARALRTDAIDDPELRRILSGNVLWSRAGIVTALVLAPLGLLLPGILCALAAAPNSTDTSRQAQVVWAVCLFVPYVICLALAGGTWSRVTDEGIETRTCWRPHPVLWGQVQAFLADGAGVVILTRSGERITARTGLATKGSKERSMRETAYLNGTFGLGVPVRRCRNCDEQYVENAQGRCRFHPEPPVSLGTRGEGSQRRSWWMYECCWLVVFAAVGDDGRELAPPLTGGCRIGAHVSPDWSPREAELPAGSTIGSTLESWLQPVRVDEVVDEPEETHEADVGRADEVEDEEDEEDEAVEEDEEDWLEEGWTRRQRWT